MVFLPLQPFNNKYIKQYSLYFFKFYCLKRVKTNLNYYVSLNMVNSNLIIRGFINFVYFLPVMQAYAMLVEQLTLVSLAVEPTRAIQEPVAPVSTRSAFWNTVLLLSELQCHTPPTRSPPSRNVELLPVTIAMM